MATHNPSDLSTCTLPELLRGGDWAGAEGFEGTLATIARQLAARSPPAHRGELHEVARLCATDMSAATVLWNLATASLRGRARGEPPPRP